MIEKFLPQEIIWDIAESCGCLPLIVLMLSARYMNENYEVFFSKDFLITDKSFSYTRFKNAVKELSRKGYCSWSEDQFGLHIVLFISKNFPPSDSDPDLSLVE